MNDYEDEDEGNNDAAQAEGNAENNRDADLKVDREAAPIVAVDSA